MSEAFAVEVLRRSTGRLRVHAPGISAGGDAALARIAHAAGVLDVRLSERTGNLLVEFDPKLTGESQLLALFSRELERARAKRAPSESARARGAAKSDAAARPGWVRAERSETIRAQPKECIGALLAFEDYPDWQTYVNETAVLERDGRGRGVRVATNATVGERQILFTTSYRFPSPNRILFEQDRGELEAVRGSWSFRSLGHGRTRATYVLEVKPGWRLGLMLRGSMFEQLRDAVLDHFMSELRARVEGPTTQRRLRA